MTLRVVHRSCGCDNAKDRPAYYGRPLAPRSLLRAADAAGCEIVFLDDGSVPESVRRADDDVVLLARHGVEGLRLVDAPDLILGSPPLPAMRLAGPTTTHRA